MIGLLSAVGDGGRAEATGEGRDPLAHAHHVAHGRRRRAAERLRERERRQDEEGTSRRHVTSGYVTSRNVMSLNGVH